MFAVISTGGKQYTVAKGDVIRVEKLDAEIGKKISLTDVLMVAEEGKVKVGAPLLAGMSVSAEVLNQEKDDKVIIFKKKRRQNYRRKRGHRQQLTALRIIDIKAVAKKAKAEDAAE